MAQQGRSALFDLEIIVVDDASDDDTCSVSASFPVLYLRHPVNRGPTVARNTGIQAGHGQYIAFLDDDDLWLPNRLQTQLPVMESNADLGLVYSPFITVTESGRRDSGHWVGPSGYVFEDLLSGNFIGTSTVLVRRAAVDRVGYFDSTLPGLEDYDLWLRLALCFPFAFVPDPVVLYRASSHGKFAKEIASGASRELHRRVVNKVMQMAPTTSRRTRERVIDRMERTNFRALHDFLTGAERSTQMMMHLNEYPRLARYADVRDTFARVACAMALASAHPFQTAKAICWDLRLPQGATLQTRRLHGRIWAEVTVGALVAGRGCLAARAMGRGLQNDPTQLVGRFLPSPRRWLRTHPDAQSRIKRLLKTLTRRT